MGANAGYWQVRYEDGGRTIVGYKSSADPIADPALKTILFRDLGRPECHLEGVMHQGGYRHATDDNLDYRPNPDALGDPWFAGTAFDASSVLPDLVGREWDTVPQVPPAGCAQPTLRVLFHYAGPSGDASAVRYVAPSGARVFSSGSLQFAWGLDTFATEEQGHSAPPDPRLQRFMRNALDDLTRPAPPTPSPAVDGRTVTVGLPAPVDPRIRQIAVYRHEGAGPFAPTDGVQVCQVAPGGRCAEALPPGHRTYTYEAVALDEWGSSAPGYSAPLVVPDTAPVARLRGPRRARPGASSSFDVYATDRDGDALSYVWRLDGRPAPQRGNRILVRFRRRGLHRVAVVVSDGAGRATRATARLRVP
jgi:hypothetical protein